MNVTSKQQNAKAWNDSLEKLNSAKTGQVQICYKDEQGNKRSGYIDIFDLQIVVEKKEMTFGKFLTELVNFNLDTQRRVETIAKGVASIKSDLMVVTVIPGKLGRTIVKDMNTMLRKAKIEVEVMSLYQLFGVSESSEMSKIIKNKLGTEFVYDEDPIFFSYAIYQTLGIGRAD